MKSWLEKKLAAFRTLHCMGRALLYALISGRNFSKKQKSRNARSPAKLSERLAQSLAEVVCVQVGNYRRTMIISNSVYLTVNQTIPRSVYISSLGVGADFVVSPTLNFDVEALFC